jgi:hypothetical protein
LTLCCVVMRISACLLCVISALAVAFYYQPDTYQQYLAAQVCALLLPVWCCCVLQWRLVQCAGLWVLQAAYLVRPLLLTDAFPSIALAGRPLPLVPSSTGAACLLPPYHTTRLLLCIRL